ncbi:DUF6344 domain-containing protein [Streptomyces gilvus]|uniref:DUF6344 domain-containing protein n=1 Tax=Streptomyces gilvus TaxID=2920937 RepID=UPI001F11708C|nr:DUF6344 domain-containing protein [Streptomyces sp. CME 23]MCH5672582.1 DUF6344 domain-containing protein [Streptomyces sp. CME 23]
MARNQVMKLWTTIVTVFLALCAALGLATSTATAAVAQTEATGNSTGGAAHPVTMPTTSQHWSWFFARALPPTMKQRIRAEAHGKSPSCRHRPRTDADASAETLLSEQATSLCAPADRATVPLQR